MICSLLLACWAQSDSPPATEGSIAGTVLAEDGRVASGAAACLGIRAGNSTTISCRWKVNQDGGFTIEHVKPGAYQIFAINDEEGYSIDNQRSAHNVTISAERPFANITIRLHGRGAILTGTITDKLTGKSIRDAQISYTAIDRNGSGGSAIVNGDSFHAVVPADCDLLVVAMANGYRGWIYTDAASPRPVLRVSSGERKVLSIQLEPLSCLGDSNAITNLNKRTSSRSRAITVSNCLKPKGKAHVRSCIGAGPPQIPVVCLWVRCNA